jgi:nucleoside-diphosphate-sugar epimerase
MTISRSVLLTGSTGFIGRATFLALEADGWDIYCGSRDASKESENHIVYIDLNNPTTILNLLNGPRFDAIVHIGAHIGWSGASESNMFCPNVLSTGCFAHIANIWGSHMVYASAAIIHGSHVEYIDADTSICLDTSYAKSKWLGEQLILSSNISHCILRIAGVFGLHGPSHLGINDAISRVIRGDSPVQIGSGESLRNYIYVKDIAEVVRYVLKNKVEGVHLLAGHEEVAVCDMLKNICEILLPELQPQIKLGAEAKNQIIKSSNCLPSSRSFVDAILDIHKDLYK